MRKGLSALFLFFSFILTLPLSSFASPADLGTFQVIPHNSLVISIDNSILTSNVDYTLICTLPIQEEETAIMPFVFGNSHSSIYINGIKWSPYTKYDIEEHKETKVAFTHIMKGSNIRIGIQNLDALSTMIFHCYANARR